MKTFDMILGAMVFLLGGAGIANYVLYWMGRYDKREGKDTFLKRLYLVGVLIGLLAIISGFLRGYF